MSAPPLFRRQALEHHAAREELGDILRLDQPWPRIVYRLLAASALAAFVFISLFHVHEYASAEAVVRVEGRRQVIATAAGVVERVNVQAGQQVERGALLLRLRDDEEAAELARANREFEIQLVRMLREPSAAEGKEALASLRAMRDQAANQLSTCALRAEHAGFVSDVRVRAGQPISAGEVLLSVVPQQAKAISLLAMVPAEYRPLLRRGSPLRFSLDGFKYEYHDLEVEQVSSEAIGPLEVERLLGADRAGAIAMDSGAKVLVTARLPASTFTSDGHLYGYYDGLTGTVDIRVRAEPILVSLVPALRPWLRGATP